MSTKKFKWIFDGQKNCYCGNCKLRPWIIKQEEICPMCGAEMIIDKEMEAQMNADEDSVDSE